MPIRKGILGVSSPWVELTPEFDPEEQKKKIAKILSVFFLQKIAERFS